MSWMRRLLDWLRPETRELAAITRQRIRHDLVITRTDRAIEEMRRLQTVAARRHTR